MLKGYTGYVTYVLRLEEDRWYVGVTTQLKHRITQHFNGDGAKWTKQFSPIELYELYNGDQEELVTEKYMDKYGYGMVRGGSYTMTRDMTPKAMRRKKKRIIRHKNESSKLSPTELSALFTT
jgi:predicted GIY-YIG superfamily endonuclease